MNDRINISGNVGVALNAEPDSTIHLHLHQAVTDNKSTEDRRNALLRVLLNECKEANSKFFLQRVALAVYGDSFFKNLNDDQLRALIEVSKATSNYRNDLLNKDLAIPADQARTCPQCSGGTWKATQLCKHCGMDLFRYDRKITEKTQAKRQVKIVLIGLAVVLLLFVIGYLAPSNYRLWPTGAALVVLLFTAGAIKK